MTGLFELLKKIQSKPGMYIGSPSATDLRLFLAGYRFARGEMGLTSTEEEVDFYRNFQPWLQKRMNVQTTNAWDKIILIQSANEQAAFQAFFQLLTEFCQRDKAQDHPALCTQAPAEVEKVA
jgi:hypothetical protein